MDEQLELIFVPVVTKIGPDTFRVTNIKAVSKVSVPEASRLYGIPEDTLYRAARAGFVECEHPSPRRIMLLAASLERWTAQIKDQEWWTEERRQRWRQSI